jgi:hypothetical protein
MTEEMYMNKYEKGKQEGNIYVINSMWAFLNSIIQRMTVIYTSEYMVFK